MTTIKNNLIKNLKDNIYTYLGPSKEVPDEVGVFAAMEIPANVDPFKICNSEPKNIEWVTDAEIAALPAHVGDRIKKFIIPGEDGRYPLPSTGLNAIDSSFYCNSSPSKANCAYFEDEDLRGLQTIRTTKFIHQGEEILLSYEITPKCSVCYNKLTSLENFQGCKCKNSALKCKGCCIKTIRGSGAFKPKFEKKKVVGYRAVCDICKSEFSGEILNEIVRTHEDEDHTKAQEHAARNRLSDNSFAPSATTIGRSVTLPSSKHNGLKALVWMSEDKRWHDASVWEYEGADKRTLKEARNGGPVRKRGQFRYTFYDVAEPGTKGGKRRKSQLVEDYFSEDDSTVVIVGVEAEVSLKKRKGGGKGGKG